MFAGCGHEYTASTSLNLGICCYWLQPDPGTSPVCERVCTSLEPASDELLATAVAPGVGFVVGA